MTRVIEFLISLGLVLALFLIIGLMLPATRHLEDSVETNRKMTIVYDTLNSVHRLKDWNHMLPSNPAELSYSGAASGVGARVDFASRNVSQWEKGSWEITTSTPPPAEGGPASVSFAISDGNVGHDKSTTYALEPTGKNNRNVKITQTYDVHYGINIFGRYVGMYVSRNIGDGMKSSLAKLSNLLASIPNFDYKQQGTTLANLGIVDVPAEDVLYVTAGNIDRNTDAIKGSINANQEWINRAIAANPGIEVAGPVRIVTTDFGQDKYAFDVAVPVRKKGSAPDADAAAPAEVAADAGELKVSIPGGSPVKYAHVAAHKAVNASYTGYMAELDNVRNSVRAWAMANGYEVADRPYESWKAGVDKSFTADGQFDVYWAIKQ